MNKPILLFVMQVTVWACCYRNMTIARSVIWQIKIMDKHNPDVRISLKKIIICNNEGAWNYKAIHYKEGTENE